MDAATLSNRICEYARTVPSAGSAVLAGMDLPVLLASSGAVRPDGEVDLDALRESVMSVFGASGHVGLLLAVLGFGPSDAEAFFSWLSSST